MEVATTNNHNQNHLHHRMPHYEQQQQTHHSNSLSLHQHATDGAATSRSPFQREVREWQRIDPNTGALHSGRLEADRWVNGPLHSYGKKSTSSLSSNNSSSTNSTMSNTYKSGGKLSLHAIVGNNMNNDTKSPTLPTSSTSTTHWPTTQQNKQLQQGFSSRHYEQPTLYGNSKIASKSRVGVTAACDCTQVDDDAAIAAVDDVRSNHSFNHHHHHHHQAHQSNDDLTPTQLGSRQQRRDLESFRHYGNTAGDNVYGDDDDDLRSNTRHQRRQQSHPLGLTRSRSISTDDLSTDSHSEEPSEWRRVSKLRRSFQNSSHNGSDSYTPPATRRPLDLPSNSRVEP